MICAGMEADQVFLQVQNLTDRAIYALVEKHTSLERIHLSYCDNITVPAVFWLLQRLDRLTHLSLTGVPAFLREELQSMCRTPPKVCPRAALFLCCFSHGADPVAFGRNSTITNVAPFACTVEKA